MTNPDLVTYDWIVINSSAGKDSQAMLDHVVTLCDAAGVPRSRLVVLHCDLGKSPKGHEIEWPGTKELAEEHAAHYGLRFIMVKRGVQGFLEKIEGVGFWPRSTTRYCTSFFKRDQGQKAVNALASQAAKGPWPANLLEMVEHRGMWPSNEQRYCTSKTKQDPANTALTALADEIREGSGNSGPLDVTTGAKGFLENIEARGMWPSSTERLCTSTFKRDTANTAMTALADEARGEQPVRKKRRRKGEPKPPPPRKPRILQCFGFRAQESTRRKKLKPFTVDGRTTNTRKTVEVWLPIHGWKVEEVWARIKQAGTRHHWAYDKGMSRLSCRFCIFAPRSQLILSGRLNPELLQEYVEVEQRIGHRFRLELSLVEVQQAIANGETGEECGGDDGCWNM